MNQRHGSGKLMYENGEYDGNWTQNQRHGTGILTHDGHLLEGQWKQDDIDSAAEHMLSYPGGTKYTGLLQRQETYSPAASSADAAAAQSWPCLDQGGPAPYYWLVPNGEGLMKAPDGQMFDGQFHLGRPRGRGVFIDSNHVEHRGVFGQDHEDMPQQQAAEQASAPVGA